MSDLVKDMLAVILFGLVFGFLTAVLHGAPPQAPCPPQAPEEESVASFKPPALLPATEPKQYDELRAEAIQSGSWLVVVVGNMPAPAGYKLVYRAPTFQGDPTPRVIYAYGARNELWRHRTEVAGRERRLLPFPFFGKRARARAHAEGKPEAASSWPTELEFLADLEVYDTARMTQKSGNRSGLGANYIVPRAAVGEKWLVPGGLQGLTGWRNVLLRSPQNRVQHWFNHADPGEAGWPRGVWGSEIIHQRRYEDGALFADVLIGQDDEIFEVRTAEKKNGEWQRRVVYRNEDAAPAGYRAVSMRQCRECHEQAGTGGYGVALIPGGDTILSDPIPALE